MPLYPSKVLRARECTLIPYSSVILSLGLTFESLKELGARHLECEPMILFTLPNGSLQPM
jgi:hypothetical protein